MEIPQTSKPPQSYSQPVVKLSDEPLLLVCLITPSTHPSLSSSAPSFFFILFILEETLET